MKWMSNFWGYLLERLFNWFCKRFFEYWGIWNLGVCW